MSVSGTNASFAMAPRTTNSGATDVDFVYYNSSTTNVEAIRRTGQNAWTGVQPLDQNVNAQLLADANPTVCVDIAAGVLWACWASYERYASGELWYSVLTGSAWGVPGSSGFLVSAMAPGNFGYDTPSFIEAFDSGGTFGPGFAVGAEIFYVTGASGAAPYPLYYLRPSSGARPDAPVVGGPSGAVIASGTPAPTFHWTYTNAAAADAQEAWQITVQDTLTSTTQWDTGKVGTAASPDTRQSVVYGTTTSPVTAPATLTYGTSYQWQAQTWDQVLSLASGFSTPLQEFALFHQPVLAWGTVSLGPGAGGQQYYGVVQLTAGSVTAGVATLSFGALAATIPNGSTIQVSNATPSDYNGSWTTSGTPTTTSVSYSIPTAPAAISNIGVSPAPQLVVATTGPVLSVSAIITQAESMQVYQYQLDLLGPAQQTVHSSTGPKPYTLTATPTGATFGPVDFHYVDDVVAGQTVNTDGSTNYYLRLTLWLSDNPTASTGPAHPLEVVSTNFLILPHYSPVTEPSSITATPDPDNGWVLVSWQKATSQPAGVTLSGHILQYRTRDPQGPWTDLTGVVTSTAWLVWQHLNEEWDYRAVAVSTSGSRSSDLDTQMATDVVLTGMGVFLNDTTQMQSPNTTLNLRSLDNADWPATTARPKVLADTMVLPAASGQPIHTFGPADYFDAKGLKFFIPDQDGGYTPGVIVEGTDLIDKLRAVWDNRNPMLWRNADGDAYVVVVPGTPSVNDMPGGHFETVFDVQEVRGYDQPVFVQSNQLELTPVPGSVYIGANLNTTTAPDNPNNGFWGFDSNLTAAKYFQQQLNQHLAMIEWNVHWNHGIDPTILAAINANASVPGVHWQPAPDDIDLGQVYITGGDSYGLTSVPYTRNLNGDDPSHWLKAGATIAVANGTVAPQTVTVAAGWSGSSPLVLTAGVPIHNATIFETQAAPGAIPFTLPQIVAGSQDSYIDAQATTIAQFGQPVILRLIHEMNQTWYTLHSPGLYDPNGHYITLTDHVNAWQYIYNRVKAIAQNALFSWCPYVWDVGRNFNWSLQNHHAWNDGAQGAWNPFLSANAGLWPGTNYVDYIGLDGYNWAGPVWNWFSAVFQPAYRDIAGGGLFPGGAHPTKPIIIAEHGCDHLCYSPGDPWPSNCFSGISQPTWMNKANWYSYGYSSTGVLAMPNVVAAVMFQPTQSHWGVMPPDALDNIRKAVASALSNPNWLGYPAGT
jgi:hypothetical protein